jgi:hypothetical protein
MIQNSIFIVVLAAIFVAASGMKPVPQDNLPGKKKTTHIKVVTIKDGEKEVLDTIIQGSDLKVLHEGKSGNFTWTAVEGFPLPDSLKEKLEVMKGEGKGNRIMVRRGGMGRGPIEIREIETLGDSGKMVTVQVEKSGPGEEDVFIMRPGMGPQRRMIHAPLAPGMSLPHVSAARIRHIQGRNVIDLSDPGIISFEKKKLSGGREKITIIRNEVKQNEQETFDIRVDESVNNKVIRTDIRNAEQEIKVKERSLGHPIDIEKK